LRITHSTVQAENNAGGMDPFLRVSVTFCHMRGGTLMVQKVLTVSLIGAALAIAACNTVRGAARDVNSVANCTENAINGTKSC
jgi:predicted small secreted protein